MVLPRWLARVNRRYTNRVLGAIPDRISPFVTVHHVGRRSGQPYKVPLAGFITPSGILLTPTYGPEADWVRNLLAAESFEAERRGQVMLLENARLVSRNEAWPYLPVLVRLAMRIMKVRSYVMADNT